VDGLDGGRSRRPAEIPMSCSCPGSAQRGILLLTSRRCIGEKKRRRAPPLYDTSWGSVSWKICRKHGGHGQYIRDFLNDPQYRDSPLCLDAERDAKRGRVYRYAERKKRAQFSLYRPVLPGNRQSSKGFIRMRFVESAARKADGITTIATGY